MSGWERRDWRSIAKRAEGPEQAVEQALRAIEFARRSRRVKYEMMARSILGTALVALGRAEEGVAELRTAVMGADRLGTPSGRWNALAALGEALFATGDDDGAAAAYGQAGRVITSFAATLTEEHAGSMLAAPYIEEILRLSDSRPSGGTPATNSET
jgi:hypothetical protein